MHYHRVVYLMYYMMTLQSHNRDLPSNLTWDVLMVDIALEVWGCKKSKLEEPRVPGCFALVDFRFFFNKKNS